MPVCVICNADGCVSINDSWYCKEHLDEALYEVGRIAALNLGWPDEEVVGQLANWLVFTGYYNKEEEEG